MKTTLIILAIAFTSTCEARLIQEVADASSRAHEIKTSIDQAGQWRTWTSRGGTHQIDGRLVGYGPGTKFTIETEDGTIIVNRQKISKADQAFLRSHKQAFRDKNEFERYNECSIEEAIEAYNERGLVTLDKTPVEPTHYDKVAARQIELRANREVHLRAQAARRKAATQLAAAVSAYRGNLYFNPIRSIYSNQLPGSQSSAPRCRMTPTGRT